MKKPCKEIDLQQGNDRKFLKNKGEEYANSFLAPRMNYTLVRIIEEQVDPLIYDGGVLRTIEEDKVFA